MTLEECARRLTEFANKKPRHWKTRAYLETLPPRKKPVTISADEFQAVAPRKVKAVEPIERRTLAKPSDSKFVRKDRMRPRAKPQPAPKPEPTKKASRWACRPGGFRFHRERRAETLRVSRTMEASLIQRILLHAAQEGRCGLCGEMMTRPAVACSIDHVIPRSLEGADGFGNLLLCHGECNGRKTNDAPTGCEMVFLLAVNARLGVLPQVF